MGKYYSGRGVGGGSDFIAREDNSQEGTKLLA